MYGLSKYVNMDYLNVDIPKYVDGDTLHLNLGNHPILNAILKHRKHPSIKFPLSNCIFPFSMHDKVQFERSKNQK